MLYSNGGDNSDEWIEDFVYNYRQNRIPVDYTPKHKHI